MGVSVDYRLQPIDSIRHGHPQDILGSAGTQPQIQRRKGFILGGSDPSGASFPLYPSFLNYVPPAFELEARFQPRTSLKLHHGHRTMQLLLNHNEHERRQTMRELQVSALVVSPIFTLYLTPCPIVLGSSTTASVPLLHD